MYIVFPITFETNVHHDICYCRFVCRTKANAKSQHSKPVFQQTRINLSQPSRANQTVTSTTIQSFKIQRRSNARTYKHFVSKTREETKNTIVFNWPVDTRIRAQVKLFLNAAYPANVVSLRVSARRLPNKQKLIIASRNQNSPTKRNTKTNRNTLSHGGKHLGKDSFHNLHSSIHFSIEYSNTLYIFFCFAFIRHAFTDLTRKALNAELVRIEMTSNCHVQFRFLKIHVPK